MALVWRHRPVALDPETPRAVGRPQDPNPWAGHDDRLRTRSHHQCQVVAVNEVEPNVFGAYGEAVPDAPRAAREVAFNKRGAAPLANQLVAGNYLAGAEQHSCCRARWTPYDVEAPVQAIGEITVGMTGRPIHRLAAWSPLEGM